MTVTYPPIVIPVKAGIQGPHRYLLRCYVSRISSAFSYPLFGWLTYILIDKVMFSNLNLFIDGYLFLFFGLSTKNKKRSTLCELCALR